MHDSEAILNSIEALRTRMDERFDQMNGRVRKTEQQLGILKAFGGAALALATFLGWDVIKAFFKVTT